MDKAKGDADGASADAPSGRGQMSRRTYIVLRLAEVRERIAALAAERDMISAKLKATPGANGREGGAMRDKRTYLSARIAALREEQKALANEKSTVGKAEVMEFDRRGSPHLPNRE